MMEIFQTYLLPCIFAFVACIGFSVLFNIHGLGILICAVGGGLGWLVYLVTAWTIQLLIRRKGGKGR